MEIESIWYIEGCNPDKFVIPQCLVCKEPIEGVVAEIPCETHLHTKCFEQVKDKMKDV